MAQVSLALVSVIGGVAVTVLVVLALVRAMLGLSRA
jgi:hypothetical protein